MTKFKLAEIPDSEREKSVNDIVRKWECGNEAIRTLFMHVKQTSDAVRAEADAVTRRQYEGCTVWLNDTYQVLSKPMSDDGIWVQLSIKRRDRQVIHDWRHLQRIKNEIVGPECEGVEMYPAESRLVDTANQYWLHVCTDPSYRFPFGFNDGRIVNEESVAGSVQRPFEKEEA